MPAGRQGTPLDYARGVLLYNDCMSLSGNRHRIAIIVVCFLAAAFFLFFRLGKGDPVTDEVELAFRGVGYMDFLATPFQTTPLEWFSPAPRWVKLTFHDHPPVIFALEHVITRVFGDSLFTLRVPFAVLGLGSLLLLYLVARSILGERAAILALAIGSLNTYMTWIGRIGLQEELVIFFTLLSLFFLIKAQDRRLYFFFWGAALGLGLLAKYTSAIILPVSVLYLWYFNRPALKKKYFYLAILFALLMFSPILIYNFEMYRSVGHFDLQFSSFLGEGVSAHWQSLPGKQIGSLGERLSAFYPNLWKNDLPLVLFLVPSFGLLFLQLVRGRLDGGGKFIPHLSTEYSTSRHADSFEKGAGFLFWTIVFYHLLILAVGPSQRFLVMLAPWGVIAAAYWLTEIWKRNRLVFAALLVVIVGYQAWYNAGTNLIFAADVEPVWRSSKLRIESAAYGYNELEDYLRDLLDSKKPAVSLALPEKFKFIEKYRQQDYRRIAANPEASNLIIYDPRINQVAKLWLFDRRYYYDGWPFVSVDEYLQVQSAAPQYFQDLGISDYFYIAATDSTFTGGNFIPETAAAEFERQMFTDKQIQPETEIINRQNQKVFRIYRFSL